MACFRPLTASQGPNGDVAFYDRPGDRALRLPCGRCVGCRLDYALGWSVRCMHEAQMYQRNCFLTLTYDDEHVPPYGSLFYPHVQKFLKRLRKRAAAQVRFFCAGEYGEHTARPHYHLLLFNFDFDDKSRIRKDLYDSRVLSSLWSFGHSGVGSVTPASAMYVARYSLKKVYGRVASEQYYSPVDTETGEVRERRPEFCTMSRRPGLGARWFEKYASDCLPCDYVVVEGRKVRVPRFYNSRFESLDPTAAGMVVEQRQDKVLARPAADRMPDRLRVAEEVTSARIKFFSQRGM